MKHMEREMENMIKEKEHASKMVVVPLEALPITVITTTTSYTISTGATIDQLENAV